MQFGRSKQKRSDCPLATLALALDGAGFPRCSEVLKGNVSEPGTLQAAIERLEAQRGAGPLPTVVMDAGLSTEANLAWLRARGYPWITVQRGRAPRPDSAPDAAFATRAGHPVQAWRVDSEGDETHLRVWSQQRQQKDEAIVARRRERFEAEVRALHAGLARKGCTKRYDKVLERLGRLKERYRQVAGQYDIAVERGSGKGRPAQLATAIRIEPNGKHPARDAQAGMYVLRTSHTQWGPERVVQTYWQLAEIEAAFRSLKGEAGLRPIFHVKPSRIRAHLFLAVLAYHGVHLLRKRLAQGGPPLQLGDDPPPARRLGPPHHLPARGRRPLDPVPPGLPPRRQSRRTGPGHRPDAGPASHAHQPRGGCHAVTVFHAIIGAPDRFCDAITPDLHPQVISFQSLVLSRIQI